MIRLRRRVSMTGAVALVFITTSLFGQAPGRGQERDLPQAPPAPGKVVVATPAPPSVSGAPSTTDLAQAKGDAATSNLAQVAAELSSQVQRTLALGRPKGLAHWISDLSQKKKYRIGYTPFAERILAKGFVARQLAKNDARTLTASSLTTTLVGMSELEIKSIIDERFETLTGLKVPENKQGLVEHIKRQNAAAREVLNRAPRTLALTPQKVPTKDMTAFNWTQKGFSAANSGIVTAVQNQDKFNNCKPGSCWAFATVGAFEAAYAKKNGVLIGASEQYLLNCAQPAMSQLADPILSSQPWSCAGGWWAFDVLSPDQVQNAGLPLRNDMPFTGVPVACPSDIDKPYQALTWGYVTDGLSIPTNDQLKAALCEYGPLVVAVFGDPAWIFNQGDVIDDFANQPDASVQVNHAVVLVGWDDTRSAWIIKNSWGTGYGIPVNGVGTGFLYIAYGSDNLGYSAAYVVAASRP